MQKVSLGVKKGGGLQPKSSVDVHPQDVHDLQSCPTLWICGGIHLGEKLRTHVGESPETMQV